MARMKTTVGTSSIVGSATPSDAQPDGIASRLRHRKMSLRAQEEARLVGDAVDVEATASAAVGEVEAEIPITEEHAPSLKGEWLNIALLLALYMLQGIPIGLASSVPMYMLSKGADYKDQAIFSLASWPYALKLLWAPVVDALYTTRFNLGHRKSWIIPMQLIVGVVMIVLASRLDVMFGGSPEGPVTSGEVDVVGLTAAFFVLYFLVATQDIAVDAWAISILRPENVGYASTANTVGQTVGIMTAYGILMGLDSATFSNMYIRPVMGWPPGATGVVTMSGFMMFWGVVFLACTCLVWLFKREVQSPHLTAAVAAAAASSGVLTIAPSGGHEEEEATTTTSAAPAATSGGSLRHRGSGSKLSASHSSDSEGPADDTTTETHPLRPSPPHTRLSLVSTSTASSQPVAPPGGCLSVRDALVAAYRDLWTILCIPQVLTLMAVVLTNKFGFSAVDNATSLVLQQKGMRKETIAWFDMVSTPIQLALQLVIAKHTAGPRPITLVVNTYLPRLAMSVVWLYVIYGVLAPETAGGQGEASTATLVLIFIVSNVHALLSSLMFICQTSFFNQISDPALGGTYMTMLNTLSNLSGKWPQYITLRGIAAFNNVACVHTGTGGLSETVEWGNEHGVSGSCEGADAKMACIAGGGSCVATTDGYVVMMCVGTVYGLLWWLIMRKRALSLESHPRADWLVRRSTAVTAV